MAAPARELLRMFSMRYEPIVLEMQTVIRRAWGATADSPGWFAMVDLYARLPIIDFSRDLLEPQAQQWRVLEVPPCGWSDLGTPARVADTLRRVGVLKSKRAKRSLSRRSNLHQALLAGE
ncbi:MAG TPA: hypothetical protein VGN07_17490 [Steroidobacteraceae bacterium]|jgi:hypothetical protein